jgi:protease-4
MAQLILALAAGVAGCGPGTGYIIRPIPADERLTETSVACDPGWFVTDKIALVDLEGVIMNQRDWSIFSGHENPVGLFVEKVDRAQEDPAVKGLVVRINSPGGGVTASEILHKRLLEFRSARKGLPVIAVIEDVGASGGYYVACGADSILAHPTSVTGSIGVLMQTVSFSGTMRMLGIEAKAITSGPLKDMASPFKPLEQKDQAVLQGMVSEFYGRFVDAVARGRPQLKREDILKLADGRVYSGLQAKANGLVDDVSDVAGAVALAKKRSGAARVKVVMYSRPWGYRENYYSQAPAGPASPQVNLVNLSAAEIWGFLQPQFLYLWTGRTN